MKQLADDFINNHTHINYYEAIIDKLGLIEYVKPSHVETMIRITGESRETINKKMPIWDAPIIWLVNYTGCIAVWSQGYMKPKEITMEQEAALNKLINSKLVENYSMT